MKKKTLPVTHRIPLLTLITLILFGLGATTPIRAATLPTSADAPEHTLLATSSEESKSTPQALPPELIMLKEAIATRDEGLVNYFLDQIKEKGIDINHAHADGTTLWDALPPSVPETYRTLLHACGARTAQELDLTPFTSLAEEEHKYPEEEYPAPPSRSLTQLLEKIPALQLRSPCLLSKTQSTEALGHYNLTEIYQALVDRFCYWNFKKQTGSILPGKERPASSVVAQLEEAHHYNQMELAYLGELAWQGMKASTTTLTEAMQKEALKTIQKSYTFDESSHTTHWRCIQQLGLLSNTGDTQPTGSTYFPHLTWQEWFAARHHTQALIAGKKTHAYQRTCQLLRDEKYTRNYQVMLPFMAGLLYAHAIDEKQEASKRHQPLATFWDYLLSPPHPLTSADPIALRIRCLEACHADTTSTALCPSLRERHKALLQEASAWVAYWVEEVKEKESIDIWHKQLILPLCHTPAVMRHHLIDSSLASFLDKKIEDELWRKKLEKIAHLPLGKSSLTKLFSWIKKSLAHKDWHVRSEAHATLRALLPHLDKTEKKAYLTSIEKSLADKDRSVRQEAQQTLRELLPHLDKATRKAYLTSIEKSLADKDSSVRSEAHATLRALLPHLDKTARRAYLTSIEKSLADKDSSVRQEAQQTLRELLPHLDKTARKAYLTSIEKSLADKDRSVRQEAQQTLRELLPHLDKTARKAYLTSIEKSLADESEWVRKAAHATLRTLLPHLDKTEKKAYLTSIEKGLADESEWVRKAAHATLRALLPHLDKTEKKAYLTSIDKGLADQDWHVRWEAQQTLRELLPHLDKATRKAYLTSIEKSLADEYSWVRKAAHATLRTLLPHLDKTEKKACLTSTEKSLADKDSPVRSEAQQTLQALLPHLDKTARRACLTSIEKNLADKDWHVRWEAHATLRALLPHLDKTEKRAYLTSIEKSLADKDWDLRRATKESIICLGKSDPLLLVAHLSLPRWVEADGDLRAGLDAVGYALTASQWEAILLDQLSSHVIPTITSSPDYLSDQSFSPFYPVSTDPLPTTETLPPVNCLAQLLLQYRPPLLLSARARAKLPFGAYEALCKAITQVAAQQKSPQQDLLKKAPFIAPATTPPSPILIVKGTPTLPRTKL